MWYSVNNFQDEIFGLSDDFFVGHNGIFG